MTSNLPAFHAFLNSLAAISMLCGYYFIRQQRKIAHRNCMITTLALSTLFLISYTYYHFTSGYVPFSGTGIIRPIYFFILTTHIVLAILTLPLIIITVTFALRDRFDKHKGIAHWALPIWLYVAITGVIIYVMAYILYPPV